MKTAPIYVTPFSIRRNYNFVSTNNEKHQDFAQQQSSRPLAFPASYPVFNISFKSDAAPRKTVPDVDYFSYRMMSPAMKRLMRKRCLEFNTKVKTSELENKQKKYLPLLDDNDMQKFVEICSQYNKLKDDPILCLGRSPKWFLNTSLWMKDGIDNYKFVAFSKFWYRKQGGEIIRMGTGTPTVEEEKAYKKYLKNIQADPKHIVEVAKRTGKKVVITDYIHTGKGVTSFLDLLSKYAEQDGILDEFANSIRIYGIGSMEYMEKFYNDDEEISEPRVQMPERLWKYSRVIPQEFHDMPLEIFEQMLINENTNECRASFYPHDVWTIYKPDRYKTGKLSSKKIEELKQKCPKSAANFTPAMKDYRNLLNFRILDYLNEHELIRGSLGSKQWD